MKQQSPETINAEIMTLLDFTPVRMYNDVQVWIRPVVGRVGGWEEVAPRNYVGDLNCCAELEAMLTLPERVKYVGVLWTLAKNRGNVTDYQFALMTASALDRATAWLEARKSSLLKEEQKNAKQD